MISPVLFNHLDKRGIQVIAFRQQYTLKVDMISSGENSHIKLIWVLVGNFEKNL